jgi:hypothetical protein
MVGNSPDEPTRAAAGVEERAIIAQREHRSVVVARRHIRDGSLFRGNAVAAVGL